MKQFNPDFSKNSKEMKNLLGEEAEQWAKDMKDDILKRKFDKRKNQEILTTGVSTTQFRKFYEKILELNDKAQGLTQERFEIEILPFLKMLNSKVEYAKTRELVGQNFVNLFRNCIKNVNTASELQNFKYFLEAIIGYMPKK